MTLEGLWNRMGALCQNAGRHDAGALVRRVMKVSTWRVQLERSARIMVGQNMCQVLSQYKAREPNA